MARIVNIGASGSGKSHYSGKILERVVPKFDLACHFDIEDEEKGLSAVGEDPIYQTLRVTPEMAQQLDWVKVFANHRKIRVVPEDMTMGEKRELYAVICEVVMALCKDAKPEWSAFVSCDEAHNMVPQNAFDERVERLVTGGRKHGVECLHITQRPQLLHKTVLSQSDRRIYFSISEDNDLKKIDKQCGFSASILDDMPDRCCVVENKSTGESVVLVTDPDYRQHVPDYIEREMGVEIDETERQRPHYSGDDGLADDELPV